MAKSPRSNDKVDFLSHGPRSFMCSCMDTESRKTVKQLSPTSLSGCVFIPLEKIVLSEPSLSKQINWHGFPWIAHGYPWTFMDNHDGLGGRGAEVLDRFRTSHLLVIDGRLQGNLGELRD